CFSGFEISVFAVQQKAQADPSARAAFGPLSYAKTWVSASFMVSGAELGCFAMQDYGRRLGFNARFFEAQVFGRGIKHLHLGEILYILVK
ncbi:MAG: hypothetical protein IT206_00755, partial [Fimbriimonadaceae bacterium]|nr:hypothetical protein [Fimbriimonadaceae bacterium]